uniref:RNA-directed RNA polymerase n=1 Tax=Bursaphelenchus xylophilus TaxID=6326 RepID=A0A1I7SNR9_BURXY
LYNFFSDIITAMVTKDGEEIGASRLHQALAQYSSPPDEEEKDRKLWEATNPENFKVDRSYKGPFLSLPLKKAHVVMLIEHFKSNKVREALKWALSVQWGTLSSGKKCTILHPVSIKNVAKCLPLQLKSESFPSQKEQARF